MGASENRNDRETLDAPWTEIADIVRNWTPRDSESVWRVGVSLPFVGVAAGLCWWMFRAWGLNGVVVMLVGGGLGAAAYTWNACQYSRVMSFGRTAALIGTCVLFPIWGYALALMCMTAGGVFGVPQSLVYGCFLVFMLHSWVPTIGVVAGQGLGIALFFLVQPLDPDAGWLLLEITWHVCAATGIGLWSIRYRQLAMAMPGRCSYCGYSLEGLASVACPECGKVIEGNARV